MTGDEQQLLIEQREAAYWRALRKRFSDHCIVRIDTQLKTILCLIENLQLAFRQEKNVGQSRQEAERFVRELIEVIDPEHGTIYDYLMFGFDG